MLIYRIEHKDSLDGPFSGVNGTSDVSDCFKDHALPAFFDEYIEFVERLSKYRVYENDLNFGVKSKVRLFNLLKTEHLGIDTVFAILTEAGFVGKVFEVYEYEDSNKNKFIELPDGQIPFVRKHAEEIESKPISEFFEGMFN